MIPEMLQSAAASNFVLYDLIRYRPAHFERMENIFQSNPYPNPMYGKAYLHDNY